MNNKIENNQRSTNWCLVLYPQEDKTHELALKIIEKEYDYACIEHDNDINDDGEIKKSHVHVVLKFKHQRWRNSIALELGITPNYLERCRNLEKALKYLIHYDNQEKYQYDINNVRGTLKQRLLECLEYSDMNTTEKFKELMDFIFSYPTKLSLRDFLEYVCSTTLFDIYRRNAMTFNNLIKEHNELICQEKMNKW